MHRRPSRVTVLSPEQSPISRVARFGIFNELRWVPGFLLCMLSLPLSLSEHRFQSLPVSFVRCFLPREPHKREQVPVSSWSPLTPRSFGCLSPFSSWLSGRTPCSRKRSVSEKQSRGFPFSWKKVFILGASASSSCCFEKQWGGSRLSCLLGTDHLCRRANGVRLSCLPGPCPAWFDSPDDVDISRRLCRPRSTSTQRSGTCVRV